MDGFLAEREAVSGLARRLSHGDVHAAEDLEQEVWEALVARPPRQADSPRGWLRAVARTRAVERLRRRGRASRAEREAARPEAVEGVDEACARREGAERMARALRELDEPYRAVLLLRFVDDLPPREVARRLGRPVETVRTQTRRGLAQLRAKLEAREPRKSTWALAFAFLRRPKAAWPVLLTGAAGVWLGLALATTGAAPDAPDAPARRADDAVAQAASVPLAAPAPSSVARAPEGTEAVAAGAPPTRWLELGLQDAVGAPLAGAAVALITPAGERPAGSSDAQGRLRVPLATTDLASARPDWPLARDAVELSVRSAGLETLDVFVFLPERGAVRVDASLARPGRRLEGRIVDAAGRPLAGARVHAAPREGTGSRERLDPEGRSLAVVRGRETDTDLDGRFVLEGLPRAALRLAARARGHALAAREVERDASAADLVLASAEPLRGTALLGGLPAAGARVGWSDGTRWPSGWCSALAGPDGHFELPRPEGGRLELEARLDGALASASLDLADGAAQWTARLAESAALELQLVEADGRPAAGLYLCLRGSADGELVASAECDAEGRVRFTPERPGPYDLVVLPRRGAGGWPREVIEALDGSGARLLRLAPAPAADAALVARFAADVDARLVLRHVAGGVEERASPEPDGRLAWSGLPAGRWSARAVYGDGSERALGEFTLAAGETLDLGRLE